MIKLFAFGIILLYNNHAVQILSTKGLDVEGYWNADSRCRVSNNFHGASLD